MSERYNKPSENTENWHVPLNENFDSIGNDVDQLESDVARVGDMIPIGALQFAPGTTFTSTDSTYTDKLTFPEKIMFDGDAFTTGYTGSLYFKLQCQMSSNHSTDTAYVRVGSFRLGGITGTETQRTHTSIGFRQSPWALYDENRVDRLTLELKADGAAECEIMSAMIYVGLEIE